MLTNLGVWIYTETFNLLAPPKSKGNSVLPKNQNQMKEFSDNSKLNVYF